MLYVFYFKNDGLYVFILVLRYIRGLVDGFIIIEDEDWVIFFVDFKGFF